MRQEGVSCEMLTQLHVAASKREKREGRQSPSAAGREQDSRSWTCSSSFGALLAKDNESRCPRASTAQRQPRWEVRFDAERHSESIAAASKAPNARGSDEEGTACPTEPPPLLPHPKLLELLSKEWERELVFLSAYCSD